jgi:hypothetical protein
MEAFAPGIELHAALHHHGPGHQRALGNDPGAVALVAAQVRKRGAQRLSPEDRAAVVPAWPAKIASRISGKPVAHQLRIAAEAVAREQEHVTGDQLLGAVGALHADAQDAVSESVPERHDTRRRQHIGAGSHGRTMQGATSAAPVRSRSVCMRWAPCPG